MVLDDCAFRCRFNRHRSRRFSQAPPLFSPLPSFIGLCSARTRALAGTRSLYLVLLTLATYAFDVLAGYFGAKYFGATKWGTLGAILGALVGLFFGLIGLFVGPVIGAVIGEVIAGKRMIDAGRAGWGSLLGNLGAMLGQADHRTGNDHDFPRERSAAVLSQKNGNRCPAI